MTVMIRKEFLSHSHLYTDGMACSRAGWAGGDRGWEGGCVVVSEGRKEQTGHRRLEMGQYGRFQSLVPMMVPDDGLRSR
jgi:hypothetical protein